MSGYTQPLHIDFIMTYEDVYTKCGYWFLTWIHGPDRIVAWCKLHDGNWRLETPSAHNMFPVPDATETIGIHRFVRSGNLREFRMPHWLNIGVQIMSQSPTILIS